MKSKKFSITKAFIISISLAVIGIGITVIYALLVIKGIKLPDFYEWHFDILMSFIIMIPAILLLRRRYGLKLTKTIGKIDIPVFSIFVVLMFLLIYILQPLVNPVETYKKLNNGFWLIRKIDFDEINVIVLVVMGFFIPVTEELFFRGIILKQFLKNYTIGKSLIWSSLIFAFWHIFVNPFAMLYLFLLGLFFGLSFYKTRSVFLPILLHIINNLLAIVTVNEYVVFNICIFTKWLIAFVICLWLVVLLTRFIGRINDKKKYEEK